MTTTDYLINAMFVFVVLRQARERKLELRSFLIPLGIVVWIAQMYVHSIPTSGNDLVLVGLLGSAGIVLGLLGGFATRVRLDEDCRPTARVGWIAGGLLIAGICSRMVFVLAITNGAGAAVRSFSISHQISAAAWPLALVAMAMLEVVLRQLTVAVRAYRMAATVRGPVAVLSSAAR